MKETERNLHPHAEARLAMALWSHEYAYEQTGGSMDFWDSIGPHRQDICRSILDDILKDLNANGRAEPHHAE